MKIPSIALFAFLSFSSIGQTVEFNSTYPITVEGGGDPCRIVQQKLSELYLRRTIKDTISFEIGEQLITFSVGQKWRSDIHVNSANCDFTVPGDTQKFLVREYRSKTMKIPFENGATLQDTVRDFDDPSRILSIQNEDSKYVTYAAVLPLSAQNINKVINYMVPRGEEYGLSMNPVIKKTNGDYHYFSRINANQVDENDISGVTAVTVTFIIQIEGQIGMYDLTILFYNE